MEKKNILNYGSKNLYEISKLSAGNSGLIIRTDQFKVWKNSRALFNNQV